MQANLYKVSHDKPRELRGRVEGSQKSFEVLKICVSTVESDHLVQNSLNYTLKMGVIYCM